MSVETHPRVKNPSQELLVRVLKDPFFREYEIVSGDVSFLAEGIQVPVREDNATVMGYIVECDERGVRPYSAVRSVFTTSDPEGKVGFFYPVGVQFYPEYCGFPPSNTNTLVRRKIFDACLERLGSQAKFHHLSYRFPQTDHRNSPPNIAQLALEYFIREGGEMDRNIAEGYVISCFNLGLEYSRSGYGGDEYNDEGQLCFNSSEGLMLWISSQMRSSDLVGKKHPIPDIPYVSKVDKLEEWFRGIMSASI